MVLQMAQEELVNVPKFALKSPVPDHLKRRVLTRWLSQVKAEHQQDMHLYCAQKRCVQLHSLVFYTLDLNW